MSRPLVMLLQQAALAPNMMARMMRTLTQSSASPQHQLRNSWNPLLAAREYSTQNSAPFGPQVLQDTKAQWQALAGAGQVNPCHSKLHPAVVTGVVALPEGDVELSVQEAYTPRGTCFGCGPSHPDGLHLRSMRIKNGLEAVVQLDRKYVAFPGIVNGGIVGALIDCHANWAASVALMDRACLPKPPLTLTASTLTNFKAPTPPGVLLLVRSLVVSIKDSRQPGIVRASVEVETTIHLKPNEGEALGKVLVQSKSVHKRMGALRAL
mmetsp:Transcript_12606/g.22316  ORF Transcript_12606/g.22316 Transcript_12606/m.22316 type:complete len:266 (+) Transcript_12606:60-857(+)